jgi:hypothetical protein
MLLIRGFSSRSRSSLKALNLERHWSLSHLVTSNLPARQQREKNDAADWALGRDDERASLQRRLQLCSWRRWRLRQSAVVAQTPSATHAPPCLRSHGALSFAARPVVFLDVACGCVRLAALPLHTYGLRSGDSTTAHRGLVNDVWPRPAGV